RATYDLTKDRYEIRDVVSLMEPYPHVNDDTFTNASAAKALRIATAAAKTVGVQPDPRWTQIAGKLDIPFSTAGRHHLDFDPGTPLHDPDDNDLAFLMFPSPDLEMDATARRNDYRIAAASQQQPGATSTSMGLAPLTIAAATTGDTAGATRWLADNISNDMMKPPFNVRTETPDNNTGWFLTGSAGFVQSLVYGLTGLRIEDAGLVATYPPILPSGWKSLALTNVTFRGKRFDITLDRDVSGKPRLRRTPALQGDAPGKRWFATRAGGSPHWPAHWRGRRPWRHRRTSTRKRPCTHRLSRFRFPATRHPSRANCSGACSMRAATRRP